MQVRDAVRSDLAAITEIYNHEVRTSTSTFDTDPRDVRAVEIWFESHQAEAYPLLVAEEDGEIVGWGSLSPWSDRGAYAATVEGSLFIKEGHRSSGVGLQLTRVLCERARRAGHRVILGRIEASNEGSRQLMLRMGFRSVGVMHGVGEKFGRTLDVEVLELVLNEDGASSSVTLRAFTPEDVDACFRIRAEAYVCEFFDELGPEAVAAAINVFLPHDYAAMARAGAVQIAENVSGIVGFCVVRRLDETTGEVFLVYVRRDFHRRGVGRLLVGWAESWLREGPHRLERIVIDTVIPDCNQRFYERIGYAVVSRHPHEFPGKTVDAVRLEKRIGS